MRAGHFPPRHVHGRTSYLRQRHGRSRGRLRRRPKAGRDQRSPRVTAFSAKCRRTVVCGQSSGHAARGRVPCPDFFRRPRHRAEAISSRRSFPIFVLSVHCGLVSVSPTCAVGLCHCQSRRCIGVVLQTDKRRPSTTSSQVSNDSYPALQTCQWRPGPGHTKRPWLNRALRTTKAQLPS